MAEEPREQPQQPQIRIDRAGIVAAGVDLGKTVVTALPPGFLMLCLINLVFLMMIMWFLHDQNENIQARTQVVEKIITACINKLN